MKHLFLNFILLLFAVPALGLQLELGERVMHVVPLVNNSQEDWGLQRVLPSCDCITIADYPAWLPAQTTGDVVVWITGKTIGSFDFQLEVHGQGSEAVHRRIDFPVNVVPAVRASGTGLHPLTLANMPRNQSLYCGPTNLLGAVVIDVRDAESFRQVSVPGSIRKTGTSLRHRPNTGGKPIVLIDRGWGEPATERICKRLRSPTGSDVHILRGGLASWMCVGGAVEGSVRSIEPLSMLRAQDFLTQAGNDDWRLLVFAAADSTDGLLLSDGQVQLLSGTATDAAVLEALGNFVVESDDPIRVLIVDENRPRALQRVSLIRNQGVDAVFCLSDGVQPLTDEIVFHQKTRLASKQTVSSVNSGDQSKVTKGGCRSCP